MKWQLYIGLLFIAVPAFSQRSRSDFNLIDQQVQSIKTASPVVLAKQLTTFCTTDLEKTRAIFRWITDNIAYRTRQFPQRRKKGTTTIADEPHDTAALKPLDERVAETVLENGMAVCDGYSRLFKTLCNYAGVRSETISGYARTESYRPRKRFAPNHTWNAVMIDSVWMLLDVTWASGYITWQGDNFIRHLDEQYFLTTPEEFIKEHYPDDLSWTLMTDPPLMEEFRHSPFKQRAFVKYKITAYRPEKGVIEASPGDTILVEVETSSLNSDRQIMSDPFLDTSIYSTLKTALLVPDVIGINKITYTYIVTSSAVQWLYILYNDDIILRYKLNVHGEEMVNRETSVVSRE